MIYSRSRVVGLIPLTFTGTRSPRVPRRCLVLGLDGGTFDLLDPLMKAGEMPFLASLAARGARAPTLSVYPAKTIPAWYSFATGKDPGELGVFGFMEPDGGPGLSHFVQSFRPAEAFWDTLSRSGAKVGVLNLPIGAGYPVHGFILPGFFSDASATFPTGLRTDIEAALGCPYPSELPVFRAPDRARWMRSATRALELRAQSAAMLAARERPDLLFVLFRETDRIEHQMWSELDRPVEEIPPDLRAFWRGVDSACAEIDRAFRDGGGPAVTFVVSDHGHGAVRSDFLTNRWLAEEGFLRFTTGDRLAARRLFSRALLASQKYSLGRRLGRPVAEALRHPGLAPVQRILSGPASFEATAPRIDWSRTLAYSYPVPEGIYLNRYNPDLTPSRGKEVVRDLKGRLEAYPDARIEVLEPSEIYRGNNLSRAPALLIRIDGMETEPWMDFRYDRPLVRERPAYFYGSGTHRMAGVLIAGGDGIRPLADGSTLGLTDLAPTILESMGVAPSTVLHGRSWATELGLVP
jgi:predicted AlkP superfamily phosphohydrolase/phosphomutase